MKKSPTMTEIVKRTKQQVRYASDVIENIEDVLGLVDSETAWLIRSMAFMGIEDVEQTAITRVQKCIDDDLVRGIKHTRPRAKVRLNSQIISEIDERLNLIDDDNLRVDIAARINTLLIEQWDVLDSILIAQRMMKAS